MKDFGHGSVGTREKAFTALLPLKQESEKYSASQLLALSELMKGEPDTVKDGADPEENLLMTAGYTYFGQFIDHDLTFDNTSSLNPADVSKQDQATGDPDKDRIPSNLRTPRLDLDSLYGDGPDAHPFMYDDDGASLLFKDSFTNQCQSSFDQAHQDLLRSPNGRAIIGDKRNDENSIVSQIHLSFVKFHNAVVAKIKQKQPDLAGTALFEQARNQVRWAYQKLVIEDFLPRIVKPEVLKDLQHKTVDQRKSCYALYTEDKRSNLPREFVVAAYRFGHSGVRTGYRLNESKRLSIFPPSEKQKDTPPDNDSLLGFDPLPLSHTIDNWGRFFPCTKPLLIPYEGLGAPPTGDDGLEANPAVRLQFAYKLDTTMVDPLTVLPPSVLPTSSNPKGAIQEVKDTINSKTLPDPQGRPSLALLNLLRGNTYQVQGGQKIAQVLKDKKFPVEPLNAKYLVVRQKDEDLSNQLKKTIFKFTPICSSLLHDTPLWFYILAEAQTTIVDQVKLSADGSFEESELTRKEVAQTQLGWVGGRIVAEVFYGLIDSDKESYIHQKTEDWHHPIWANEHDIGEAVIFANLLKFAGQHISHPQVS
jgi:Animal haem peroxidase